MKYDLIIIGGGTAGLRALSYAENKKVAIIEKGVLGGTCLLRGCIPSKILIERARIISKINKGNEFRIKTRYKADILKALQDQREIVKNAQKQVEKNATKLAKIYRGEAKFIGKNKIKVNDELLEGKKIIICTGSKPFVPSFHGLNSVDYFTSDTIFSLNYRPKKVLMIGGGYISLEFAYFFKTFGIDVTIIEKLDSIIKYNDEEVRKYMWDSLEEQGIKISCCSEIKEIYQRGKKKYIALKDGRIFDGDLLMINTGRKNNLDLDLEKAEIKFDKSIKVNDYLEAAKNIYAIGDVNGKWGLAHTAKYEAEIVVNNAFGKKKKAKYLVPSAIFTYPEVASVGMTEQQVKNKKIKYDVMKSDLSMNGKAKIMKETGFVKIIHDKKGRILGAHVVGPNAAILVHEYVALMFKNGTINDLYGMIHIHPTLNELDF